MLIRREFQAMNHLPLALSRSGGLLLILGFGRVGCDQSVSREGLEFDRVGASLGGRVNQGQCQTSVAVMVDPGLGNDEHAQEAALRGMISWKDLRWIPLRSALFR